MAQTGPTGPKSPGANTSPKYPAPKDEAAIATADPAATVVPPVISAKEQEKLDAKQEGLNKRLLDAAKAGNLDKVQLALKDGAFPDAVRIEQITEEDGTKKDLSYNALFYLVHHAAVPYTPTSEKVKSGVGAALTVGAALVLAPTSVSMSNTNDRLHYISEKKEKAFQETMRLLATGDHALAARDFQSAQQSLQQFKRNKLADLVKEAVPTAFVVQEAAPSPSNQVQTNQTAQAAQITQAASAPVEYATSQIVNGALTGNLDLVHQGLRGGGNVNGLHNDFSAVQNLASGWAAQPEGGPGQASFTEIARVLRAAGADFNDARGKKAIEALESDPTKQEAAKFLREVGDSTPEAQQEAQRAELEAERRKRMPGIGSDRDIEPFLKPPHTEDKALELAKFLRGKKVDEVAKIERDAAGNITKGIYEEVDGKFRIDEAAAAKPNPPKYPNGLDGPMYVPRLDAAGKNVTDEHGNPIQDVLIFKQGKIIGSIIYPQGLDKNGRSLGECCIHPDNLKPEEHERNKLALQGMDTVMLSNLSGQAISGDGVVTDISAALHQMRDPNATDAGRDAGGLAITKALNGERASIELIRGEDGKYSVKVPDGFTGVVLVPQFDKDGNLIEGKMDMLVYGKGKIVDGAISPGSILDAKTIAEVKAAVQEKEQGH